MIYAFADFELDTRSFELRRTTGEVVAVEPQVFDVVRHLVEHADRLVTKEELQDAVWGTRFVTESAVTSRIKSARRALDDDGRAQRIVRTVHGRGYRLVAEVGAREDAEVGDAGRAPPSSPTAAGAGRGILERDRELGVLEAALADAEGGRGSVVLEAGEAGIGKTALVRALAERARARGARVLVGGCDDLTTPRTLGPLRDVAAELDPALADALARGVGLDDVLNLLPGALAGGTTVLVLEDLHWADDATLDLVRFLGRRAGALPTVLVLTYRAAATEEGRGLRRLLGSLTGSAHHRLELAPLSLRAVAALAGEGGPAPADVFAITRGNPFFVAEVLAAGDLAVPPTVRARNDFERSDRWGRAAVEAAERAGDPAVLVRALVRFGRTVYWSQGPRAAAEVVDRAMSIAEHLEEPGTRAAIHAEQARARSDLVEVGPVAEPDPRTLTHAERSLALAEELGSRYLRGHALQYRGTGRLAVGDPRGLDDLAAAVADARLDPRDELPVRACVNAAGATFRFGRLDDAERYVELGLSLADGSEFTAGAYRLELTLQGIRLSRGDWDDAEVGLRALVAWPGDPGLMQPLAAGLLARLLARRGRVADARAVLAPVAQRAAGSPEIALVGPTSAAAVELAWLAGEADAMPALAAPGLALASEVGHRTSASELCRYLQRAGHAVAVPDDPVDPWAPGLAGRWAEAAAAWAARGHRYERALELATSGDQRAAAEGLDALHAFGAAGSLAVLAPER